MLAHIQMYILNLTKPTHFTIHLTTQFTHVLRDLHTHTLNHSLLPPQLLRGQPHSIRAISYCTDICPHDQHLPTQRMDQ
jgi:hypothetical protein